MRQIRHPGNYCASMSVSKTALFVVFYFIISHHYLRISQRQGGDVNYHSTIWKSRPLVMFVLLHHLITIPKMKGRERQR